MATSVLQQYNIADFLEWNRKKQLKLNPVFQRLRVWTRAADSYFIDTILRQLPIPKIYLRTVIDLRTKKPYREVVDGQQRLRAIIKFAADGLTLGQRAKEFEGLRYSMMSPELQERFLSYAIGTEQLINATDEEVLEIFARLNSYNVRLNAAELRHAEFRGEFKWAVHETAQRWSVLWTDFGLLTTRQRVRMLDDSLMAEMYGAVLKGVTDGGQPNIRKLYMKYEPDFPGKDDATDRMDKALSFIVDNLGEAIDGPVARAPHFLMLFAAAAHALFGIPDGRIGDVMPPRDEGALSDIPIAVENINKLSTIIEQDEPPDARFLEFWNRSSGTTQRISSRKVRFLIYYRALLPERL